MTLVAGIDCSTQSCTVVVRDAETGALVRSGRAPHPHGTEVHPGEWERAYVAAADAAGGLGDCAAVAVGAQQHGMVALDAYGDVVRPALLWNDLRSADAAAELTAELGGPRAWVEAVALAPLASFTVTKLRWMATEEPANAAKTEAVCLPHDWLTWRLGVGRGLAALTTDRSDASGTGYWSSECGYRTDLLALALGRDAQLPRVLRPHEAAGETSWGAVLGPGCGDNAGAALGLGAEPGDVVVSLGTSGVACAVSSSSVRDPDGVVAGFCDATGVFLPLIATVSGAQTLDSTASLLGVDHAGLSDLALQAPSGCDGLVFVPYLEGERSPDKPHSTGALHGMRLATQTPAHLARAAIEGMLCGLADAVDALVRLGVPVRRVLLVGGAARSEAVRRIAPAVLGHPVVVPPEGDLVADGAARQAAWVLSGEAAPPTWSTGTSLSYEAVPDKALRDRYAEARELTLDQLRA